MSQLTRAVRDTSVRLLREELEQRAVKAEMETEKYRALAVMVAGVAHEINTPIGIVNTAASIVRQRLEFHGPPRGRGRWSRGKDRVRRRH